MTQDDGAPAEAAGPATYQHGDEAQTTWLHAATGRIVRLHFRDGKTLVGQLLSHDRGTLIVQGGGTAPLLVYKQSLAYLAVDDPAERT